MREALEEIFNIKITDEDLFKKALTHPSFTKENNLNSLDNYERLEFFGDAVLKLAISENLIKKYPKSHEGELTKIRSILISDATLSKIAEKINITDLIILGSHAEKAGERKRSSINACVFEALLGAFYLDGKQKEIIDFLNDIFEDYILDIKNNMAKYKLIEELGPAHEPKFKMEVLYQNRVLATAIGTSKKDAEQKCAYEACKKLGVINE